MDTQPKDVFVLSHDTEQGEHTERETRDARSVSTKRVLSVKGVHYCSIDTLLVLRGGRSGAWSTALHMLVCAVRPALTACLERVLPIGNGARGGCKWWWLHAFRQAMFNFDRGPLCANSMVSGRVLGSWLVVARVPFLTVIMLRWALSWCAKVASKMVHVAPNAVQPLIEDCSASRVSFLDGIWAPFWLWVEFDIIRPLWLAGYSHSHQTRVKNDANGAKMALCLCSMPQALSLPLSPSFSPSLDHDAECFSMHFAISSHLLLLLRF
jgi:hypothetical protein